MPRISGELDLLIRRERLDTMFQLNWKFRDNVSCERVWEGLNRDFQFARRDKNKETEEFKNRTTTDCLKQ